MRHSVLAEVFFGSVRFQSWTTDIAIAIPRILAGVVLPVQFGLSKFPVPEWFVQDIGRLGFPAPALFAWAAVLTEVLGSFLLAAGLFTRVVGVLLVITMFVAAFVQKANSPLWERLPALFFMLNAYMAVVLGSGRLGLDALIRARLGRGRAGSNATMSAS